MSEKIKEYDKENPHKDIGKQKFRVRKFYSVWVEYDVVAENRSEAESAVMEHGGIKSIDWADGYHNDEPVEMYANDWNSDYQAESDDEQYGRTPRVQKIEECVPYEEQDIDTNEWIDNYEDPEWTSDSYRWTKEEVEDAPKVKGTRDEIPF